MNGSRGFLTAACFILLGLCGCNKLRLAYEFADWLVIYTVNDNFELDKAQHARFKRDVKTYFQWHRREMLPRYAEWLRRGANSIEAGFHPLAYDSAYAEFRTLYGKTLEPVVDPAKVVLLSLNPEQRREYAAILKKKNRRIRKEFNRPLEQKLEDRYRKTLSVIEDWAGHLSGDQKKKVREWSHALPWNGDLWLENREKIQARMIGLLEAKNPSSEEIGDFLEDYFLRPEKFRSLEYQVRYQEYETRVKAFLLSLNGILTPNQKARFLREVESQVRELEQLGRKE